MERENAKGIVVTKARPWCFKSTANFRHRSLNGRAGKSHYDLHKSDINFLLSLLKIPTAKLAPT